MGKKVEEKDYWLCGRCDINTVDNPDRMCPCPRGGCEAEIIGKIITTTDVVLNDNTKKEI